ncbi:MAG: hypothetical protein LBV12_01065 [Puniceicoccales bacterium]|nr:hypothetical protein [Puniceicoccales bacterium]
MDVVLAKIPTDFWPNLDDAMQAPKERTWHFGESLSNISLARVMRYRAWRLAQSGDADVALLFAGKIAKLSHAHGEISADGVDAMVIFMVMEIGYQTIWDIAANFSVSSESLQQARQMIQESRFTDDQLRLMFRRGFSIGSKIVRVYYEEVQLDGIWEDGAFIGEPYCQDNFMTLPGANRILPSAFLYKPNKTLRLRADCFREMMSWIKPETDGRAAQQLMDDFKKNKIRSLARGRFLYDPYDALGRAAVVWSIDGFPSLLKRKLYYDSSASVTETALAVREYEMKYAKLPESLSELVPEFLSSVPTDYMDGQPIRYSKEERAVWSIGKKFDLTIPLPPPGSNDERLDSICRIPVLPNR